MRFSPKYILECYSCLSLKQRYLNFTILFSFIFLCVAYFGWYYVKNVNEQQLMHVEDRTDASDAIYNLLNQIHSTETSIFRFISEPKKENENNIRRSLNQFDSSLETLLKNPWIMDDAELSDLLVSLGRDSVELLAAAEILIKVRKDENEWIPAVNIMQTRMFSSNTQLLTELGLIIDEISEESETEADIEAYKKISELRHWWETMIAEFRLLITNKFGFFTTETVSGIDARISNMDLYIERVDSVLVELEELARQEKSSFIYIDGISQIRKLFTTWFSEYSIVTESLSGEDWRHDMVITRDQIEPVLSRILQRASSLQLELGVASARNITDLSALTKELSNFVIFLAVLASIAGLFSFFLFHRSIVQSINRFGLALQSEAKGKHKDTSKYMISKAEEFRNLMSAFEDMRDQIRTRETHLDHIAHHDPLTQLPNRVLLRDRLQLAVSRSRRNGTNIALMFIDLDQFKQINDALGHSMGDQLLVQLAGRLTRCVRETDTVSRHGGDEFTILLEDISHVDQVASLARNIISDIAVPFDVEHHILHTTASIGIAMGPGDDSDVDALIKDADIAMYHAKDLGRGNFKFYSGEMAAKVAEYMVLENQLRKAIDNNELFLLYQPVVDMRTELITSTEALLRWQHPERGVLSPDAFLSVIEETGLIRPITQWVLDEASRQQNAYKKAGFGGVRMAVNMSGVFLKNDSVLDVVINTIEHTDIDPKGLIMEITEDTLLKDLQGADKALATLKDMGISIALDDFGTGQSSLSHLRLDAIDIVKIDRSFVRDIPDNQNDMELVDAIIAMSHKLHKKVVAEGVETQQQLEFMRWHNCDSIQGYYYSKPCSGDDVLRMLSEGKMVSNG